MPEIFRHALFAAGTPHCWNRLITEVLSWPYLATLGGAASGAIAVAIVDDPLGVAAVVAALMVPLMGGVLGFYAVHIRRMTRGLPATTEGSSIREAIHRQAQAQSRLSLWMLELSSLLMLALSVWIVFPGEPPAWMGVPGVLLFGLGTVMSAYQIRMKAKQRHS